MDGQILLYNAKISILISKFCLLSSLKSYSAKAVRCFNSSPIHINLFQEFSKDQCQYLEIRRNSAHFKTVKHLWLNKNDLLRCRFSVLWPPLLFKCKVGSLDFNIINSCRILTCCTFCLSSSSLLFSRAICFLKLSRFKEAKQDCDSALQLEPGNKKAFYRRALAYKGLQVPVALHYKHSGSFFLKTFEGFVHPVVFNSFYVFVCVSVHDPKPRTICQPAVTSRKSSSWTQTLGRLSRSLRWWRACWDRASWTALHTHRG